MLLGASLASAQDLPPDANAGTPSSNAPPIVSAPLPTAAPPVPLPSPPPAPTQTPAISAAAATVAVAAPSADDHDRFIGHAAIGYLGVSALPIAASGTGTSVPQSGTVNAPVIGIRYWFGDSVGLDVGVGLGIQTGSEAPSSYGYAFHAGVPLALAHASHYVFEIVPEATVGFTTGTIISTSGSSDATVGGFLLKVGARAGAELHFGFIGIPQLALQAGIGLYLRRETISWSQNGVSSSGTSTLLTTSVNESPWGIFTDSLSALYYF
jgi:hypothetical protein